MKIKRKNNFLYNFMKLLIINKLRGIYTLF